MYLISLYNNEIELFYIGVMMLLYKTIFYGLLLITKYMLFLSLLIKLTFFKKKKSVHTCISI